METRFQALQDELHEIRQHLNMTKTSVPIPESIPSPIQGNRATAMTRANSAEPLARDMGIPRTDQVLDTPMASLYEVTKLRNIRSDPQAMTSSSPNTSPGLDPIARGQLSLLEGERLFATFEKTLDAYLLGRVALVHDTWDAVRASSALLSTAIMTVTALHLQDQGRMFDICYPIFLQLASHIVFARYHTLDDIRGLCIGAFFLSDLSWKLSGLAVRIATELNLHQFTAQDLSSASGDQLEKARLWYLLYVCDHHFSIAYGRPPVISESAVITRHETVLEAPEATQSDLRLHSQVGVFIILSRIFQTFGPDQSRLVAGDEFEALRRYDTDLSLWRDRWERRLGKFSQSSINFIVTSDRCLAPDKHISQYPSRGVILHYHFARLQLFSICLRGLRLTGPHSISNERREFVNIAIVSATSILSLILDDPDMRRAIIGVPLYLLTAITYASLFLMKVQSQWKQAEFDIRYEQVVDLVQRTIGMLNNARQYVRHVTHYVGAGLDSLLRKLQEHERIENQQNPSQMSISAWGEAPEWASWDLDVGMDCLDMLDTLYFQMP